MITHNLLKFLSLFFISLLSFSSAVLALEPIVLQADTSIELRSPHIRFYKDTQKNLSINDILKKSNDAFTPLDPTDINQGFSDEVFWLKLKLSNSSNTDLTWVISHETSYLDLMHVHYKTNEQQWQNLKATDHKEFSHRSLPYRKLNFSHTTPANQSTELFIKLQMIDKDALTLALKLQSKEAFNTVKSSEQFLYGIYFGVIITLILISLIFSIKVRQDLYFIYTLYLIMHLLFWGFLTGYTFQYVIPDYPIIYNQGFNIVFLLFFMAALQFSKKFLNIRLYSPKLHKVLSTLQLIAIFAILLRLVGVYELVVTISHLSLLSLVLLPLVGWQSYRKGLKYARWYIFAWIIFGIGILLSVLSASTNLFDWGMEPILYTQIASLFESFLLMLALADKVNQVNKELVTATHKAQQDPLTKLGNRRLLEYKLRQIQKAENHGKNYWCLVLDIDDFKLLNDTHGHAFGDVVLKKMASIFKNFCRPEDLVIRYGGEEFVILIESSDVNIVKYIAERIRMNVESTVLNHKNVEVRSTISIGISAVSLNKNQAFELSFQNADKALYHVKNAKKNGIALYQDSEIITL